MRTPATAPSASVNSQPVAGLVCRHIHTLGHRCGSPCLRGEEFCYFHHTNHRPPPAPITDPELLFAGPHTILDVPSLEDRPAIQLALLELARRVGNNTIDDKRAKILRSIYHSASINLAHEERAARSGRTISKSARDLPANRLPQPIPIAQATEIVQDVTFSPTLGPLAPVLEYGLPEPEEECEPSLASIIDTYLNSPPPPAPIELEKRPYDFDTLQLLRRTLATTTNPETATRIRKALEEEALLPNHNLHIQACIDESATASESGAPGSTVSPSTLGLLPPPPRSGAGAAGAHPPRTAPGWGQCRLHRPRRAPLPSSRRPVIPLGLARLRRSRLDCAGCRRRRSPTLRSICRSTRRQEPGRRG